LFAELALNRNDVGGLADLGKLPVTTKADYVAEPESFVLGAAGAADDAETVVWDIMYPERSMAGHRPVSRCRAGTRSRLPRRDRDP
jgi:hypothetical protein